MYKYMLLFGLLVWSSGVTAQDLEELPENDQIKARRVAYITQRLSLTSEESASFWGLYNEYEAERRKIRQAQRLNRSQAATDAEAEAQINAQFESEAALLALKRDFYERAKNSVPPRKLVLLPRAEREFKRDLLRQLRNRRRAGPRGRG
ncbi:MAG: hypothetical protein AAGJ82_14975 [Bacteroidota bacterium]